MNSSGLKYSNNSLLTQSRNKLFINMENPNERASESGRTMRTFNSTKAASKIQEHFENNIIKRNISNDGKVRSENKNQNIDYYMNILSSKFKKYENAKYGTRSNGCITGYGVNTNQGSVRSYNEDRVSIILNVIKPNSRKNEDWPKVSFFGIYDGHGGNKCADFLKENLHQYVRILI